MTEVMVTMVVMVVMGRWKQTAELGPVPNTELENVFMAVAVDDDFDLHPKNKRLPATRLGWAAASMVYGLERPSQVGEERSQGLCVAAELCRGPW